MCSFQSAMRKTKLREFNLMYFIVFNLTYLINFLGFKLLYFTFICYLNSIKF